MVWEKTDKSRSGLLDFAFDDMSYQRYAKFILDTTPIFAERNGEIISVDKNLLKNYSTLKMILMMKFSMPFQ